MKKVALILFLIICAFFAAHVVAEASLGLYIGDQEVPLDQPLSMVNGSILVPLRVISEYLGADITWSAKGSEVTVDFPAQTIIMQVGGESALVDGVTHRLDVPIEFQQGDLMVPIRFFADQLGLSLVFVPELMALRVQGPGLETGDIETPTPPGLGEDEEVADAEQEPESPEEIIFHKPESVQSLREIAYMGGPRSRVFIDVTNYSRYESMLLVDPDRLVIDLFGVTGGPLPEQEIAGPIVKNIRSSQFDGNTIRIVFDLNEVTGYEISQWPNGGLEIEFNYQLTALGFERVGEETPVIWLDVTDEPPMEIIHLVDPARLVIDLQNTSLIGTAVEFQVSDESVRRVRASQFMPSVTRIVLELDQPMTPLTVQQRDERHEIVLFEGTKEEAEAYKREMQASELDEAEPLDEGAVGGDLSIDVELPDGILTGKRILIDPGHGGSDPGAIGPYGTFEKDVNLAISLYLGELLKEAGAEVFYTRDSDQYVSIFERPEKAESIGADALISIHCNSYVDQKTARGTETLYHPECVESQLLAQLIQSAVVNELQLYDRGIRARTDLAVLNGSAVPTAMIETAFINHPEEEVLLRASGFQQAAAQGVFNGIVQYFLIGN